MENLSPIAAKEILRWRKRINEVLAENSGKTEEEIEKMKTDGTFDELTKKEGLMLEREREKLEQTLGGIANMTRLPGAIFVVDTIKEHIAMNEAVKLNIPIVAMVDTNSDPDIPDYIVPANDDSARTIQLVTSLVADAIIEGNAEREAMKEEELMEQAAEEAKRETDSDEEEKDEGPVKVRRRKRRRKKSTEKSSAKKDSEEKEEKEDKKANEKSPSEEPDKEEKKTQKESSSEETENEEAEDSEKK